MTGVLLVLLALSTPVAAQRTIVVQGGGSALQQAIDQASPGDTLDVLAGTYSQIVVSKGITIACRAGVGVLGSTGFVLHADQVSAGETLTVSGGRYTGGAPFSGGPISVTGCAGIVVLDGVVAVPQGITAGALTIDGNSGPVIAAVGVAFAQRPPTLGSDPFRVASSTRPARRVRASTSSCCRAARCAATRPARSSTTRCSHASASTSARGCSRSPPRSVSAT